MKPSGIIEVTIKPVEPCVRSPCLQVECLLETSVNTFPSLCFSRMDGWSNMQPMTHARDWASCYRMWGIQHPSLQSCQACSSKYSRLDCRATGKSASWDCTWAIMIVPNALCIIQSSISQEALLLYRHMESLYSLSTMHYISLYSFLVTSNKWVGVVSIMVLKDLSCVSRRGYEYMQIDTQVTDINIWVFYNFAAKFQYLASGF